MDSWRWTERAFIFLFLLLALLLFAATASSQTQTLPLRQDPAVQAYAFSMPDDGWAPLTVHFSAYGSQVTGDRIDRYEWDVDGDGDFETDATRAGGYIRHTFTRSGAYPVSVRVIDEQGRYATATTTVTVRHPASSSVNYWTIFDDSRVKRIDLLFTQANWAEIWHDPSSKTEVEADVIMYGERVNRVGVSMKGNGSLDASGDKKSWKLDFNAFIPEQEYRNLKMLLLHNNFADPSMLREKMAYDIARFAGVPSAFTAYVEVWIDIVDDDQPPTYWGISTLVERPDKKYLANRFGRGNDTGNLYKADAWFEEGSADLAYYGPDIGNYPMPRGRVAYRKMTNEEEADYTDIINLCYTIDGPGYQTPDEWAAAVEQVLNVDGFLRYLAVIFLSLNLDTYPYTGNNYYIYNDPGTGRFEWIAWDMNNSWGNFAGGADFPLYGVEESVGPLQYAPLYEKVFEVERYRLAYRAYVDLLLRYQFDDNTFSAQAETWHDMLAPYVAAGDKDFYGPTAQYTAEAFDEAWQKIVEMTRSRADFLRSALAQEANQ